MHKDALWLKKPQLRHYDHVLIMRDRDSPLFFNVTAFDAENGFTGGLVLADQGHGDMEMIATAVDRHPGDLESACRSTGHVVAVEVGLNKHSLHSAATGTTMGGVPRAYIEMVADLLPGSLQTRKALFKIATSRYAPGLASFLAQGDREARLQALRHYLPHARVILENNNLAEAIDARREFLPELASALGIDMKTARKASALSLLVSEAYMADGMNRSGDIFLLGATSSRILSLSLMVESRSLPTSGPEAIDALSTVQVAHSIAQDAGFGLAPMARVIGRIQPGEWAQAKEAMKSLALKYRNRVGDYLRFITHTASAAAAVSVVRDTMPGVVQRIEQISHQVLEDEPVRDDEAALLDTYLPMIRSAVMLANGGNGLPGRGVPNRAETSCSLGVAVGQFGSLKTFGELSERWHHRNQELSSRLKDIPMHLEWPPFMGEASWPEKGITFREICSNTSLTELGAQQNHCVGSYASVVMAATAEEARLIFTIEKDGTVLSTAEMALGTLPSPSIDRLFCDISQNQAANNSTPCELAQAAATRLAEMLRKLPKARFKAYVDGISASAGLKAALMSTIEFTDANIVRSDLPQVTVEVLDPLLPKPLRQGAIFDLIKLTPESLASQLQPLRDVWGAVQSRDAELAVGERQLEPEDGPSL